MLSLKSVRGGGVGVLEAKVPNGRELPRPQLLNPPLSLSLSLSLSTTSFQQIDDCFSLANYNDWLRW